MGRSQISIEFIFTIGIILFIFIVIFAFVINRNKELVDSKTEIEERSTCLLISSLISSAFVAGDGVIINVSIDYNATINYTGSTDYKGLTVEGSGCLLPVNTLTDAKLKEGIIRIENKNNYIEIDNV